MSHRWPLHPPPYPDESLSSWLERQACAYGYRSEDVLLSDLGFPVLSPVELDTNPPPLLLERLAERSGVAVEQLGTMTIQGWVPQLLDSLESGPARYPAYVREYALLYPLELRRYREFHDWVPWMSAHRLKERAAACRLCLREASESYRRLCWRMAWMSSCPIHEILLEEIFVVAGRDRGYAIGEPVPAPLEILMVDRLTKQAIEEKNVSLPRMQVSGRSWLRLLRALLDELTLPAEPLKQYRPTLSKIWGTLGFGVRQGMRSTTIPFERLDAARQLLLMQVAGVAVEMLMKGEVRKAGRDALLFLPLPKDQKDPPAVCSLLPSGQEEKKLSAYEQAWRKVNQAAKEVEAALHHDRETAAQMRNLLLGINPSHEKVEQVDHMFRNKGYLLPDDVL